jgi:hypothetical protein
VKAIVLERNRLVARRIARIWCCAGVDVMCVEEPTELLNHLHDADVLAADAFDGEIVLTSLRNHERLRAVLWTAEPFERVLRFVVDEPRASNILGRAGFDAAPREWELAMVARRLDRAAEGPPPFASYLAWGFTGFKDVVVDTAGRDAAVAHVQQYIDRNGLPKRVGELYGELAHELVMNALYDAPVDADGRPRNAHDRRMPVRLEAHEAADPGGRSVRAPRAPACVLGRSGRPQGTTRPVRRRRWVGDRHVPERHGRPHL